MDVKPSNFYTVYSNCPILYEVFYEPKIRTKRYLNKIFGPMGILTEDDEKKINMTFEELIKIRSKPVYKEEKIKFYNFKKNNRVTDEEYKDYIKKRNELVKIIPRGSYFSLRPNNSENVHEKKECLEENLWNAIQKLRSEQFFKPILETTKKILDIFIKKLKIIISNKDYDLRELTNKLYSNIDICKSCYEKIRNGNINNLDFDELFGLNEHDELIKRKSNMTLNDIIKERQNNMVCPRGEFNNTYEYWNNYSLPIMYNKTHKITSEIVNDYKNERRNIINNRNQWNQFNNNDRQQIAEPKNSRNSDKIKVYWDMIVRYRESEIRSRSFPINIEIGKLFDIFIEELDYIVNNYDTDKELQKKNLKNLIESSIQKYELYLEKMTKKPI